MKFGSDSKIQSLTSYYNIQQGQASVTTTGLFAVKVGDTVQLRQATSTAVSVPNQLYTVQHHRSCNRFLFWEDCHTNVVHVNRGLFHNELEAITSKLSRAAAIAMV